MRVERDKIALDAKPDEQLSGKQARRSKGKEPQLDPQPKVDAHPYDNDTKALFGQDGARIVPELVAGAEVLAAHNVEVDRSKLKADLVFQILYQGVLAILNIELQSGPDSNMGSRVLQYLAGLHDFYEMPVICVVIYLFRCAVVESPYVIKCGDRTSLTLNYEVIQWWEVDSATIVDKHAIHLYTLLPATKEPKVDLLKKALHEMFQVYKRHELGYRFGWFYNILRRTDTISKEDKRIIEKELKVQYNYEELIKDDPIIQNLLAERELKGKAEGEARGETRGEARGEIKATKENILSVLTARFSAALADQAQPVITPIQNVETLNFLFQRLLRVPDEQTVRIVLGLSNE
ncbi:MAG TPA: hypothetical protein VHV10_14840 [Ktedonobacteraceae bacterium]|jgi:predicted transposase YdaD|nr:hypothetical protein [Ktedonobacteraceae bacterium]